MRLPIFVLLFVLASPLALAAAPADDAANDAVNAAFKQMSTFCFEKVDCNKCADAFHESVSDVQTSIFEKMTSSDFVKNLEKKMDGMTTSFRNKVLEGCKALQQAHDKAADPSIPQFVFTNYSGTSTDSGVFLTTLYTLLPHFSEMESTPAAQMLLATDAMSSMNASNWSQFIPADYQQFSKMGDKYMKDQKAYSDMYTKTNATESKNRKLEETATPTFLVIPYFAGDMNFPGMPQNNSWSGASYMPNMPNIPSIPSMGSFPGMDAAKNMTQMLPGASSLPIIGSIDFKNLQIPGMDFVKSSTSPSSMFLYAIPSQAAAGVPDISHYLSLANVTNSPYFQGTQQWLNLTNPNQWSKLQPAADSKDVKMDIDQLMNQMKEVLNITTPAETLFLVSLDSESPMDSMYKMIGTTEEKYDPMFKQGQKIDQAVMGAIPASSDPQVEAMKNDMMNQWNSLKQALSVAQKSIAERVKVAGEGSLNDLKNVGNQMTSSMKSMYGLKQTAIQLPNGEFVSAQPISFYVETKQGKISHLEQVDDTATTDASPMDAAKETIQKYWNAISSGSCDNLTELFSSSFPGYSTYIPQPVMKPASDFAERAWKTLGLAETDKTGEKTTFMGAAKEEMKKMNPMSGMTDGFYGSATALSVAPAPPMPATPSFWDSVVNKGLELQKKETRGFGMSGFDYNPMYSSGDGSSFLVASADPASSCEMAKSAGDYMKSIPLVHQLFYNSKDNHGIATVSLDSAAAPLALLASDPPSLQFNEIFKNLTQMGMDKVNQQVEAAKMALGKLQAATEDKLEQLKANATTAMNNIKNSDAISKYMGVATEKLEVAKKSMSDATQRLNDLQQKLKGYCDAHPEECAADLALARSFAETPGSSDKLVTFFETANGKISKMANFKAVPHSDADLLTRLETSFFSSPEGPISLKALGIYTGLGLLLFMCWIWVSLTKPRIAAMDPEEARTLVPGDAEANYFRMQDV